MDFSLIAPCFNEQGSIQTFFERASEACVSTGYDCEIVFVDDGSADDTFKILSELVSRPSSSDKISYKVISFSRNFGKESAILAGMKESVGDHVGIIDTDMQQDPKIAMSMLEFLMENPDYDCVAAVQSQRKEPALVRGLKGGFYRVFNIFCEVDIKQSASDFRVFTRQVADALVGMPEYHRFSKGLFSWVGFKTHYIEYTPEKRFAGKSTWSLGGLFKYAFGGMEAFSTRPLKIATCFGTVMSFLAVVYLVIIVYDTLSKGSTIPGYPTLVCLLLLTSGVQLLTLGILGKYLGLTYMEGKRRPAYITKKIISSDRASDDANEDAGKKK